MEERCLSSQPGPSHNDNENLESNGPVRPSDHDHVVVRGWLEEWTPKIVWRGR